MKSSFRRPKDPSGFTLVEMLVAVAVLAILLLALAQMFSVTSDLIKNDNGRMTADDQARMIFDRLAADLASVAKQSDVDYSFISQSGNDKFFFYSEAPAFLPASAPSTLQNTAALVGYQINSSYQLERLGYGLDWDQPGASLVHLTFPNSATSFAPDPLSTINDGGVGAWSSVIGNDGTTGNYHVLSATVFRLEFCFLLRDGSYSITPVLSTSPAGWPSAATFSTTQNGAPTPASDSTQGYALGSRWWDSTNKRGYLCLQSTVGAALWRPIGWDDVSGVVVALGLLDDSSRKILTAQGISLAQTAAQLGDAATQDLSISPPQLMAAKWETVVTSSTFAAAAGIPKAVASQVRIYQRCLYLDATSNL